MGEYLSMSDPRARGNGVYVTAIGGEPWAFTFVEIVGHSGSGTFALAEQLNDQSAPASFPGGARKYRGCVVFPVYRYRRWEPTPCDCALTRSTMFKARSIGLLELGGGESVAPPFSPLCVPRDHGKRHPLQRLGVEAKMAESRYYSRAGLWETSHPEVSLSYRLPSPGRGMGRVWMSEETLTKRLLAYCGPLSTRPSETIEMPVDVLLNGKQ